MFVLGIDPGLTRCGFGVVQRTGSGPVPFLVKAAGVLETPRTDPVAVRLGVLLNDIEALLDEFSPSQVAIERIFFQTNVRTAISVAQASGVMMAAASRRGLEVVGYTPNEVKQAVVGHGGATKEQVQSMVARLCGLDKVLSPPDAADAVAIAACHLTNQRYDLAVRSAAAR